MKRLNYETLRDLNYQGYLLKNAPERILQFGEGNFLRAFVDYFVDVMNEKADFDSKVVLVQPRAARPGHTAADRINEQEGLYTLYSRGFEKGRRVNGKRVLSCVSRCLNACSDYEEVMACAQNPHLRFITSNTTEAGIVYDPSCQFTDTPAASYPGKLTQFLYRRFQIFGQEAGKGFVLLPCELIEENGKALKNCVLQYAAQWNLGEEFVRWLETENLFCSTLVDRIVTGFPKEEAEVLHRENGYEDRIIDTGEVFAFWVIEGPETLKAELPFEKAGLPVLITDDHKPYKQRKVRILNGAHTSMVLGAYLAGQNLVRDCMEDPTILKFMNKALYEEIIPTLSLPEENCRDFAAAVTERFKNPFIDHALLSISLNSTSKWKARVLPSLEAYVNKFHHLPLCLTASFAFYLAFYRGTQLTEAGLSSKRPDGSSYTVSDDRRILKFYYEHKDDSAGELVHAVCTNTGFWDRDLTEIPEFEKTVTEMLEHISSEGIYAQMMRCL
ncbi:MAG: tagaturonate reductase [Clostridiales bacterium]|nr:tagaturonate reductase [Clostridiales bacterium]